MIRTRSTLYNTPSPASIRPEMGSGTSMVQVIEGSFVPVPPVIVAGAEFDAAAKPWRKEPNSFGFDNRMEPKT